MNKYIKSYVAVWAIMAVLFNAAAFLSPTEHIALQGTLPTFWIGYSCAMAALISQLICSLRIFRRRYTSDEIFLYVPLLKLAYGCVIASAVVGGVCIAFPFLPPWLAAVVCLALLAWYAIAMLKADAAAALAASRSRQAANGTALIHTMTADAQGLIAHAAEEDKPACRKVYEALRYSDPVTSDLLASTDAKLSAQFNQLREAVRRGENVETAADELLILLEDRNRRCRLTK